MRKTIVSLLVMFVLALALAACGGSDIPASTSSPSTSESMKAGDAAKGAALFSKTCQACHGEGGVGVEGDGKSLATSEFVAGLSDAEFIAFVKYGRSSGDPLNTTGLDMPPKGGNPALNDAQIVDIIAYIRSLQK